MSSIMTGSQKVEGSNPSSSTKLANTANPDLKHLSTGSKSYTQLAIPLKRLIEGFLLSCKVENKSPDTISFYKNILDKFQWFLGKYGVDTIDATSIRQFLVYLKDSPNRWDSKNTRANRPVSPITVRSYYSGLSALFTWSMEEELIETNPMANVKKPQLPHKTVKGLEPDIINMLLNSINGKSLQDLRNLSLIHI